MILALVQADEVCLGRFHSRISCLIRSFADALTPAFLCLTRGAVTNRSRNHLFRSMGSRNDATGESQ